MTRDIKGKFGQRGPHLICVSGPQCGEPTLREGQILRSQDGLYSCELVLNGRYVDAPVWEFMSAYQCTIHQTQIVCA